MDGSNGNTGFAWVAPGTMRVLPPRSGATRIAVNSVSANGRYAAGSSGSSSQTTFATRWTIEGEVQTLMLAASSARGLSADGSVVVGSIDPSALTKRPFRWTAAAGVQQLSPLSGGDWATANAVSGDGSIVVGASDTVELRHAVLWRASGEILDIGLLPGSTYSEAVDVSADGGTVLGFSAVPGNVQYFLWREATGFVVLQQPADGVTIIPTSLSGDGSIVLGASFNSSRALLWRASGEVLDLTQYLEGLGVNLTGWTLQECRGISDDGSVVVGTGRHDGITRAFRVSGLCAADAAPRITESPANVSVCAQETAELTVAAEASAPFTYEWRFGTGAPSRTVVEGLNTDPDTGLSFLARDVDSPTIAIEHLLPAGALNTVIFDARVANSCGTQVSQAATLTRCACPACPGDFNADGGVDGDDVSDFFTRWEAGHCDADVNQDGGVDGEDVSVFFDSWERGLCG